MVRSVELAKEARRYMERVVSGEQVAGRLIRLACQRQKSDLATGHERGLIFNEAAASHAIAFFSFLRHSKGAGFAGNIFRLEPWQRFIVWCLFGWYDCDGSRRYRTAYIEIPRKNGKTTLAAGIALYLLVADNEPGAEVYSAAVTAKQARILFDSAKLMVGSSCPLRRRLRTLKDSISSEDSFFKPLASESANLDGLHIHGAVIDELHAHPNRGVWDVIDSGQGSRTQSMVLAITTAGRDENSICYEQRNIVVQVLEPGNLVEDDTYFGFIACLDKGDDWRAPDAYKKANPNFGISLFEKDLKRMLTRALLSPGLAQEYRQKRLNEWTDEVGTWLNMVKWRECGAEDLESLEKSLVGRKAYGGLDLSATLDIAWFSPPTFS